MLSPPRGAGTGLVSYTNNQGWLGQFYFYFLFLLPCWLFLATLGQIGPRPPVSTRLPGPGLGPPRRRVYVILLGGWAGTGLSSLACTHSVTGSSLPHQIVLQWPLSSSGTGHGGGVHDGSGCVFVPDSVSSHPSMVLSGLLRFGVAWQRREGNWCRCLGPVGWAVAMRVDKCFVFPPWTWLDRVCRAQGWTWPSSDHVHQGPRAPRDWLCCGVSKAHPQGGGHWNGRPAGVFPGWVLLAVEHVVTPG